MKTVFKSLPPNELTNYAMAHPNDEWDPDFRNYATPPHSAGHDYKIIKQRLIDDQGGLCAYCERKIDDQGPHLQRVEHYHPKSDKSVPAINWGLMWSNVMAVCTGGENDNLVYHPLPENLSCDSHKNHFINIQKPNPAALQILLGQLLNPLSLAPFPCLFEFHRGAGKLFPNIKACNQLDTQNNLKPGETLMSVQQTIAVLNLNCDRLCTDRLLIMKEYNQEAAKARKLQDKKYQEKLAQKWFAKKWPSFFTTRRLLLGDVADSHLQAMAYQG